MKKYLMSGIAVIAFAAAFTSCSKSTDLYDAGAVQQREIQKTENSYSDNFVKKYGQPAANHDWGFGSSSKTRGVYSDLNRLGLLSEGGLNIYAPKAVDDATVCANETELVVAEFSKYRPGVENQLNINFTDFWVHQVYKGNSKDRDGNYYKAHNNGDVTNASDKMNHLQCMKNITLDDVTASVGDNQGCVTIGDGFMEHINNFNSGNCTNSSTVDHRSLTSPNAQIKGATLMLNSGTNDFAYYNSEDSKYHNEYIIIAGADIHSSLAGYYYVGFDFSADGIYPNQQIDRDYVFNDWIVRISPAQFAGAARVICEDLGTTDDFDFNDVVFDVASNSYWNGYKNQQEEYTIITLQAAGGTLPLYLEANGVSKEVHELFGVETGTMVNTNNGTASRPIVQFTIPGVVSPRQVTVRVTENAKEVVLKAEVGQAPQKICVNTTYKWCNEREQIGDKYENFPDYVKNKQVEWY
jgi:hypothetical protein